MEFYFADRSNSAVRMVSLVCPQGPYKTDGYGNATYPARRLIYLLNLQCDLAQPRVKVCESYSLYKPKPFALWLYRARSRRLYTHFASRPHLIASPRSRENATARTDALRLLTFKDDKFHSFGIISFSMPQDASSIQQLKNCLIYRAATKRNT